MEPIGRVVPKPKTKTTTAHGNTMLKTCSIIGAGMLLSKGPCTQIVYTLAFQYSLYWYIGGMDPQGLSCSACGVLRLCRK